MCVSVYEEELRKFDSYLTLLRWYTTVSGGVLTLLKLMDNIFVSLCFLIVWVSTGRSKVVPGHFFCRVLRGVNNLFTAILSNAKCARVAAKWMDQNWIPPCLSGALGEKMKICWGPRSFLL